MAYSIYDIGVDIPDCGIAEKVCIVMEKSCRALYLSQDLTLLVYEPCRTGLNETHKRISLGRTALTGRGLAWRTLSGEQLRRVSLAGSHLAGVNLAHWFLGQEHCGKGEKEQKEESLNLFHTFLFDPALVLKLTILKEVINPDEGLFLLLIYEFVYLGMLECGVADVLNDHKIILYICCV